MQRRELMKQTLAVGAFAVGASAALPGRAPAAELSKDTGAVADARLTNPLTVPANGTIRVAFLIGPDAEEVDYAFPWGVFQNVMVGDNHHMPFKLYTVAVSKEAVRTTGGLAILPEYTFADAPTPNVVVVPAMDTDKIAPAALDWLRSVQKDADLTMSVCDGAFVLAKAGLIDGKKATCYHSGYRMLGVMYPNVNVVRGVRYVEDGKIAASGGLTCGADLAMRVVERYFGREQARQTARDLEFQGTGWMYPNSNAQFAKRPVSTAEHPLCEVCDMKVNPKMALTWKYESKLYYFCSDEHKALFVSKPEHFIAV